MSTRLVQRMRGQPGAAAAQHAAQALFVPVREAFDSSSNATCLDACPAAAATATAGSAELPFQFEFEFKEAMPPDCKLTGRKFMPSAAPALLRLFQRSCANGLYLLGEAACILNLNAGLAPVGWGKLRWVWTW